MSAEHRLSPSGEGWTITRGADSATVVGVGGGIRRYDSGGRPVLFGYDEFTKADAGRGQLLMPWPNRIAGGRYTFGGKQQQLPLTEPAKNNASHGLVRWATWDALEQTESSLTVGYRLMPSPGWDAILDLSVRYELTDDGLVVTPSASNVGQTAAPFGFGAHPYLSVGEGQVDELTLQLPADTYLTVDEQLLPTGTAAVAGSAFDFAQPRPIADTQIDTAFTDLRPGADGTWSVTVSRGADWSSLWAQAEVFPYAQVFTGDSLPSGRARRTGVAVEPMSCPAGAFATGESLVTLEPGQTWTGSWGVRHS